MKRHSGMWRYDAIKFRTVRELVVLLGVIMLPIAMAVGVAPVPAVASSKVTITFSEYPRVNEGDMLKEMIANFEAKNPDIKIEYQPLDASGAAITKLTTAMVGGTAPDVLCFWGPTFRAWGEMGLLLNLNPYIEKYMKGDLADFNQSQLQTFNYKGAQFALPQYTGTTAYYYNRDAYEVAGLKDPDLNFDWDTLLKNSMKLTVRRGDRTVQWGFRPYYQVERVAMYVRQNGGDVMAPGHNSVCTMDSPQAIEAVEFLAEMHHKYRVAPLAADLANRSDRDMFNSGALAAAADGSWSLSTIQPSGFDLGIAHLFKKVTRNSMTNIDGYAIFQGTKHPEEAFRWLAYLVSPEANLLRAKYQGLQPARTSVGDAWIALLQQRFPHLRKANLRVFVEAGAYSQTEPIFSDMRVINELLAPTLRRVIFEGKEPARQALETIVPVINARLKAAK